MSRMMRVKVGNEVFNLAPCGKECCGHGVEKIGKLVKEIRSHLRGADVNDRVLIVAMVPDWNGMRVVGWHANAAILRDEVIAKIAPELVMRRGALEG